MVGDAARCGGEAGCQLVALFELSALRIAEAAPGGVGGLEWRSY